jgi:hypothetical protein
VGPEQLQLAELQMLVLPLQLQQIPPCPADGCTDRCLCDPTISLLLRGRKPAELYRFVQTKGSAMNRVQSSNAIPTGRDMLWIPHCLDNRLTDGGKVVSLKRRPHFIPQNIIFLLLVLIFVRG